MTICQTFQSVGVQIIHTHFKKKWGGGLFASTIKSQTAAIYLVPLRHCHSVAIVPLNEKRHAYKIIRDSVF